MSYAYGQSTNFTLDFETGDLSGWTKTGNAFDFQPTLDDNPTARKRGQPSKHEGRYWIGTYERYQGERGQKQGDIQGDGPTGTLTSTTFIIPKGTLSFLIGGGAGDETRVELLVAAESSAEGQRLRPPARKPNRILSASGRNSETMHRVTWNLDAFAGKTGAIRIVDGASGGWGHINVDDFSFSPPSVHLPKPAARIEPAYLKVRQGERAVFRNASVYDPDSHQVRQDWSGPAGKRASGAFFEVSTDTLKPGTYRIELSVSDDRRQGDTASATLEVSAPVYRVFLKAAPTTVKQGQAVEFHAVLEPEFSGGEYLFTFGHGAGATWTRVPRIVHTYSSSGVFQAFVQVRLKEHIIAESEKVGIQVAELPVQYTLSLKADSQNVRVDEPVRYYAALSPPQNNVEYMLSFGDGETSNWTRHPGAEHVYKKRGIYKALVTARIKGDTIAESSPVSVTVEAIAEKPVARIEPRRVTAAKGERAVFESRSTAEGEIREIWKGPKNQQGTGRSFEVNTEHLEPGLYRVYLQVQTARDEATLEIIPPESKHFTLRMDAEPHPAKQSETVTFKVRIEPGDRSVEYRFHFGDGNTREWSREARAGHVYNEAGNYHAFAVARIGQEVIAESVPVVVSVEVKRVPIPWGEIIAGLLIASGYYVFSRIRKMRKKVPATRPVLHVRPILDSGEQEIQGSAHIGSGGGIRLKPVSDAGEPEIEAKGPLTDDERRGDA